MTITARYSGRCSKCSGAIHPGDEIEWSKGGPSFHVACPPSAPRAVISSVRGGVRGRLIPNRKAGRCDECGHTVQPGEGKLQRCYADTGCMRHFDDDGWHLFCADEAGCKARQAIRREEARQRRERAERVAALAAEVEATVPPVEGWPPKGRTFSETGESATLHYYERRWLVADGRVYWVHPQPAWGDSWEQVYYALTDAMASHANELGIA